MMMHDKVRLAGATNFRDFGGQVTADGGRVLRGRLYRSNQLNRLTATDIPIILALGLEAVVDLRSQGEREAQPTLHQLARLRDFVSTKPDTDFIFNEIFAGTERSERAWIVAFTDFYRALPEIYAEEFANYFHLLAEGTMPVVIHCSAGKDRTGVACALTLDLLGVPQADIVSDYLLSSERLNDDEHFRNMFTAAKLERYATLPEECRLVMLGTKAVYIEGMLDKIRTRYESTHRYISERLGLGDSAVGAIQNNLIA